MKLTATAEIGIPIPTVEYSNTKVGVALEKELPDDSAMESTMDELVSTAVKKFSDMLNELAEEQILGILTNKRYSKLVSENLPQKMIEKVQVELNEKYEKILKASKADIIKLRKIIEDNGLSYK